MSVNNNAINAPFPLTVPQGGTGRATLTAHGVLVGEGTSAVTQLTAGSNGQVLVGSTGADPVFATLTGTNGITFTTGAGSLAINGAASTAFTWTVITGATQAIAAGNGYIANRSSLITLTLPATSAVGDTYSVANINTALGWNIAQNASQNIIFGNTTTTTGTGGSLASTAIGDTVTIICTVASTNFYVINSVGNITVV
jgi:hypothetical protein